MNNAGVNGSAAERPQAWSGFIGGRWEKEIDVAEFVRLNFTPYDGDESFLAPSTPATCDM